MKQTSNNPAPDVTEQRRDRGNGAKLRIFLMLSYDTIFKPRLLYQILLRRGDEVCGVAEVRPPKKLRRALRSSRSSRPRSGPFGVWGWKGAFWFGTWTLFNKLRSALPFPPMIRATSTIKRVCRAFRVPYQLVDDVNSPQFIKVLYELQPDVIVSFQHQIFRRELLNVPRVACINCHPALLPKYRGNQPIFWALCDNESSFGVTVHTMQEQIDAGEILSQMETLTRPDWTLAQHYQAAYELSAVAILDALDKIEKDHDPNTVSVPFDAKYYSKPTAGDVQRFRRSGRLAV